jgi:thioredoxin reductase (NADPH)
MKLPIIFLIDDDPQVLRALARDVHQKYKKEYQILSTEDPQEALESLKELKRTGEEVALFISDQRMPRITGVELLERSKEFYPEAKRVLLTAYSDIDTAIRAINETDLDYYLIKPWDPPEEKLFPVMEDLLDDWLSSYKPELAGIRLLGYQFSPKSHAIKEFLAGYHIPYQWIDVESHPKAAEVMALNAITPASLPALIFEDGTLSVDTEIHSVAEKLGLRPTARLNMYDLVIIGAGPAGLAAAVYAGSEGLKTLLIEKHVPGGQAGTSSRIENYLGFPSGVTGAELTRRAMTQATRFGIEFLSPQEALNIASEASYKTVRLANGNEVHARSIIITTGVAYRQLETKGIVELTGAGIYYGAASVEALQTRGKQAYVIGGGNSAGQAALHLAKYAERVYIVIRKKDLSGTMSSYLVDQIAKTKNITILPETEVIEARGSERLESLVLKINDGEERATSADALFIFIGARPYSEWVQGDILKDDRGFIVTGRDLLLRDSFRSNWPLKRDPYLLETCSPGIFAAGDVRSGAMNRVASAVGEGAMAVSFVHQYLAEV